MLKTSSTFSAVVAAAETSLLGTFANTCEIIASPALLLHFLSMPHPAILGLLQSPKLAGDGEESVLLLVRSWLEGPVGQICSAGQVEALRKEVRYGLLSLFHLASCCESHRMLPLTSEQLMELWEHRTNGTNCSWERQLHSNPKHWYLPSRTQSTPSKTGIALRLTDTKSDLRSVLLSVGKAGSRAELLSPAVYRGGFLWRLTLQVEDGVLWCAINAHRALSVDQLDKPGVQLKHAVTRSCNIHILGLLPLHLFETDSCAFNSPGAGCCMSGPDGEQPDSGHLDWWESYMVDGCVCLTAVVAPVST